MELILATRKSKLAQTQTETVMAMLKEKHKIDSILEYIKQQTNKNEESKNKIKNYINLNIKEEFKNERK